MSNPLEMLYTLQEIDASILAIRKKLNLLVVGKELDESLKAVQSKYETAVSALKQIQVNLKDTELELKSVEDKAKKTQQKLESGTITNPKELQSYEKDRDQLQRHREKLDEKILSYWETLETAIADEAECKKQYEDVKKEYDATVEKNQAVKIELKQKWARLEAYRKTTAEQVPPDLLKKYEGIRLKHAGIGIAKVENDSCTACNTAIASFTIGRLKEGTGQIITCENCSRILYLKE